MKNIAAIIQARMGSTRLPGKVLIPINDRPVLWHVHARLSKCRLIGKIIVATSTERKDDPIAGFCADNKISCFRGSEDDVLGRYYQAAKAFGADAIVRITADCPLIDPEVTDRVISAYLDGGNDCAGASNVIKRTFPRGLDTEVLSFSALSQIQAKASEANQREHVTTILYQHPETYKVVSVENSENLADLRWTLDEPADLKFIMEIYKRLYSPGHIFLMSDILNVIRKEPDLLKINNEVRQKG